MNAAAPDPLRYRRATTYDLTSELEAESAYYRALLRIEADGQAIADCIARIRAIRAELERRD